jgi:hypothetical protein
MNGNHHTGSLASRVTLREARKMAAMEIVRSENKLDGYSIHRLSL